MDFGSNLSFGADNELDFENRILSTLETGEDREKGAVASHKPRKSLQFPQTE